SSLSRRTFTSTPACSTTCLATLPMSELLLSVGSTADAAQAANHDLVAAKNAMAQTAAARQSRDIEPRDIFHSSTPLANKMMVFLHVGFETHGIAFHGHFANQIRRSH